MKDRQMWLKVLLAFSLLLVMFKNASWGDVFIQVGTVAFSCGAVVLFVMRRGYGRRIHFKGDPLPERLRDGIERVKSRLQRKNRPREGGG